MKVKNIIGKCKRDVDVIDDYTEELYIAYCNTKLTEEGKRIFAEVLELEVNLAGGDTITICIDQEDEAEAERLLGLAKDMFEGMAGECAADDWDLWFYD